MSPTDLLPPGGPDRLFRLGPMRIRDDGVEASMPCGPWSAGPDGRPGVASLCVLLDAVLGQATITARPPGTWPVTTELAVDMLGPVPDGGEVTVRARVVGVSGGAVLARGDVLGPDGAPIGTATEWGRFLPGVPDPEQAADVAAPAGDTAAVLGAYVAGGDRWDDRERRPSLTLPGCPALANEHGTVHGGILAAVAELAAVSELPGTPETPLVTASLHVAYLRPAAPDGPTTVHAAIVHAGRSLGVVRAEVSNAGGRLAAVATVTRRAG